MAANRKLGRPTDQRNAILRNQVTQLLWHGKIETTLPRAKEVRSLAEKMITLAVDEYQNSVMVEKRVYNEKGQSSMVEVKNDSPSKLHARRQIMRVLYDVKELKQPKESKSEYKERTGKIRHPLVEKLFGELAPKYDKRAREQGVRGGYTRIIKKGPRRGDAAEMVIIELV